MKISEQRNDIPFMGLYKIEDDSTCNGVIDYWKESEGLQARGLVNNPDAGLHVNTDVKDSIDIKVDPYQKNLDERLFRYFEALGKCLDLYTARYTALNTHVTHWRIQENVNIQFYKPGGGYKIWHCERTSNNKFDGERLLTFMTFLNDVVDENGGAIKVNSKKGEGASFEFTWKKIKNVQRKN
jgi:hypothetical protein